jgi:hypothetical protein
MLRTIRSLFLIAWFPLLWAQGSSLAREQAEFRFADGKRVWVEYGRPLAPTSQIFGNIVPYGKVWGAGSGRATLLVTEVALQMDDAILPPGRYSIYVLPSTRDWILIVSQKFGQAAGAYPAGFDFARVKMKRRSLAQPVNTFSIVFASHGPGAGAMKLRWGSDEAWVNFEENLSQPQADGDAS